MKKIRQPQTKQRVNDAGDALHRRAEFPLRSGARVLLEESHELPLVEFQLTFRTGAVSDPSGKEGAARLAARLVRMGTRKVRAHEVEQRIDAMGASLGIETAPSYTRFAGTVIKRSLEPFLHLLGALLAEPAFRASDLAQIKRETIADIIEVRDSDRALASRAFRRAIFGKHPYARSVVGTRASVGKVSRPDVIARHARHFVGQNAILGFAGDVEEQEIAALAETCFGGLPAEAAPRESVPEPSMGKGRRVVLVDKPDRTQTQILIGCLGSRPVDPDHAALTVANTVFGGTFTARLTREVRSKRGWSYGANSRIGTDKQREAWSMWTFPAAKDAIACIRLELDLLETFVRDGITKKELRFVQDFLANSWAFEVDTAGKRLDQRIDERLYELPRGYFETWVDRIRAVTLDEANASIRKRLTPNDLVIAVLATAKDLEGPLRDLPRVKQVDVVSFDDD